MTFPHPVTGELLDSREDFQAAVNETYEKIGDLYATAYRIGRERDLRYPPDPILPEPRYRTLTQEKVARCPRCGGRLENERPENV